MSTDSAREQARQETGQFGTQPLAEAADVELVTPAEVTRLRSLAQVRESDAFCDAMEQASRESRVRHVNKGDWVRDFDSDEWGVVKSIGMHTLTTDVWRDEDTDEGDHVVEVVSKDQAEEIIAEHNIIPARVQNAYAKHRTAALDLADRWELNPGDRRDMGRNELGKISQDVWRSAEKAGLAFPADSEFGTSFDSLPEIQAMERAFRDYQTMLNSYGHSDDLGAKLVDSMRLAIEGSDRYFGKQASA